jgi:hypothetical protein
MVMEETILSIHVCVPAEWTDEQIDAYIHAQPCGTTNGWRMRHDGENTRVKCSGADARPDYVHVVGEC